MPPEYAVLMQNVETLGFIVKESMGMEQLLGTLQSIYSRDLQQLNNEKKGVQAEVSWNFKCI